MNIVSKGSGKCLDVKGGESALSAGVPLQQWTCWGGTNQKFLLSPVSGGYKITVRSSGLQLDVAGGPGATQNGTPIIQYPYWGGSNETWRVVAGSDGYFQIMPLNSGSCMDVRAMSVLNGAPVQQWACWGGANQKWKLVPAP